MAAYCTLTDLKNYIPEERLLQLTDDNDSDEISLEKVAFAISEASNLIDGYMQGRYPVPLATVPALIGDVAVKLSTYFLYKRSLIETLPEPIKDDYVYAMTVLRDVQKGRISPFPVTQNPTWFVSNKQPNEPTVLKSTTNNWHQYFVQTGYDQYTTLGR